MKNTHIEDGNIREEALEKLMKTYKPDAQFSPEVKAIIRRMLAQKIIDAEPSGSMSFIQYFSSFFVGSALTAAIALVFVFRFQGLESLQIAKDDGGMQIAQMKEGGESMKLRSMSQAMPQAESMAFDADSDMAAADSVETSDTAMVARGGIGGMGGGTDTSSGNALMRSEPSMMTTMPVRPFSPVEIRLPEGEDLPVQPLYILETKEELLTQSFSLLSAKDARISHVSLESGSEYNIEFMPKRQELSVYMKHPRSLYMEEGMSVENVVAPPVQEVDMNQVLAAANTLLSDLGVNYTIESLQLENLPYTSRNISYISPFMVNGFPVFERYSGLQSGVRIEYDPGEQKVVSISGIRKLESLLVSQESVEAVNIAEKKGEFEAEEVTVGYVIEYDYSSSVEKEYLIPAVKLQYKESIQVLPYITF